MAFGSSTPICGGRPAGSLPCPVRQDYVTPVAARGHATISRATPARRGPPIQYDGSLSPAVIPRCCPSLVPRHAPKGTRYAGEAFVSRAGEASNLRPDRSSFASHAPPPRRALLRASMRRPNLGPMSDVNVVGPRPYSKCFFPDFSGSCTPRGADMKHALRPREIRRGGNIQRLSLREERRNRGRLAGTHLDHQVPAGADEPRSSAEHTS